MSGEKPTMWLSAEGHPFTASLQPVRAGGRDAVWEGWSRASEPGVLSALLGLKDLEITPTFTTGSRGSDEGCRTLQESLGSCNGQRH